MAGVKAAGVAADMGWTGYRRELSATAASGAGFIPPGPAERTRSRRAENRPSLGEDAGHGERGQRLDVALDQPPEAVADPQHLHARGLRAAHHGADHRVETGAVSAAGQDSDFHERNSVTGESID